MRNLSGWWKLELIYDILPGQECTCIMCVFMCVCVSQSSSCLTIDWPAIGCCSHMSKKGWTMYPWCSTCWWTSRSWSLSLPLSGSQVRTLLCRCCYFKLKPCLVINLVNISWFLIKLVFNCVFCLFMPSIHIQHATEMTSRPCFSHFFPLEQSTSLFCIYNLSRKGCSYLVLTGVTDVN